MNRLSPPNCKAVNVGEFAYNVDKVFWFLNVLLLIASCFYRTDRSSSIALAIWVSGNLLMDQITPFVMNFSSTAGEFGTSVWYLTWSAINLLCMFVLFKLHKAYQLILSQIARYIFVCFLALTLLQASRYTDRVLLQTDMLAGVYKYGLLAINVSVFPAALLWFTRSFRQSRKESWHF